MPGVMAYGATSAEARARAQALALRVVADRLEHGEASPDLLEVLAIVTKAQAQKWLDQEATPSTPRGPGEGQR
jgi:hypothetical protein